MEHRREMDFDDYRLLERRDKGMAIEEDHEFRVQLTHPPKSLVTSILALLAQLNTLEDKNRVIVASCLTNLKSRMEPEEFEVVKDRIGSSLAESKLDGQLLNGSD